MGHSILGIPETGLGEINGGSPAITSDLPVAGVQSHDALVQRYAAVVAWKTKPSWFMIAEEDRMINPKTQHFMADRMRAKVHSHPVDHSPMYTEPNLVINIILEAARETLSS